MGMQWNSSMPLPLAGYHDDTGFPMGTSGNYFANPKYLLEMFSLCAEFPFTQEIEHFDILLDSILSYEYFSTRPVSQSLPLYDLTTYGRLCRRFRACLMLLRKPNICSLSMTDESHHQAHHAVIAFLCRLCMEAENIFEEAFKEIEACYNTDRSGQQTSKLMAILAYNLGTLDAEIKVLSDDLNDSKGMAFPFTKVFRDLPVTRWQLAYFGNTFDAGKFDAGKKVEPLMLPGIHIFTRTASAPETYQSSELVLNNEGRSFSHILAMYNNTATNITDQFIATPDESFGNDEHQSIEPDFAFRVEGPYVSSGCQMEVQHQDSSEQVAFPGADRPGQIEIEALKNKNGRLEHTIKRLQSLKQNNDNKIQAVQRCGRSSHEALFNDNTEPAFDPDQTYAATRGTIGQHGMAMPDFVRHAGLNVTTTQNHPTTSSTKEDTSARDDPLQSIYVISKLRKHTKSSIPGGRNSSPQKRRRQTPVVSLKKPYVTEQANKDEVPTKLEHAPTTCGAIASGVYQPINSRNRRSQRSQKNSALHLVSSTLPKVT